MHCRAQEVDIAPMILFAVSNVFRRQHDERRGYRFSLKAILVLFVVVSIPLTWYVNRLQAIANEKRRLNGVWHLIHDGQLVNVNGRPLTTKFTPRKYDIDPFQDPKWLDFYSPQGVLHGIYRWEGKGLRIVLGSVGVERSHYFGQDFKELKIEGGKAGTPLSLHEYYVERLPQNQKDQ
jgi:uncharacterized membrane protein